MEPYRRSAALISSGAAVWRGDAELILQGYAACLRKLGKHSEAGKVKSDSAAVLSALHPDQRGDLMLDVRDATAQR